MDLLERRGFLYPPVIYVVVFLLHLILPPFKGVEGYCCDSISGEVLLYRHNGLLVLALMVGGFVTLVPADKRGELAITFHDATISSFVLGLFISSLLYLVGKRQLKKGMIDRGNTCLVKSTRRSAAAKSTAEFDDRSEAEHFYCGVDWNPRFMGIDIKMFNYLVGSVMLSLNILSAFFLHMEGRSSASASPSNAMTVYCLCFSFFCVEYLYFENVHVFTYDIFRERTGMKMVWGCYFFYPFFYCIGIWPLVGSQADISIMMAVLISGLYLFGWCLTRGANLQKFYWRTEKNSIFLAGLIRNRCVPGSNDRILCSGFWALARHINYLGEIVQAIALALAGFLGREVAQGWRGYLPWLYPLYYVALFVPRQLDDDMQCARKYGTKTWDAYCNAVPYRIVPGLY